MYVAAAYFRTRHPIVSSLLSYHWDLVLFHPLEISWTRAAWVIPKSKHLSKDFSNSSYYLEHTRRWSITFARNAVDSLPPPALRGSVLPARWHGWPVCGGESKPLWVLWKAVATKPNKQCRSQLYVKFGIQWCLVWWTSYCKVGKCLKLVWTFLPDQTSLN